MPNFARAAAVLDMWSSLSGSLNAALGIVKYCRRLRWHLLNRVAVVVVVVVAVVVVITVSVVVVVVVRWFPMMIWFGWASESRRLRGEGGQTCSTRCIGVTLMSS